MDDIDRAQQREQEDRARAIAAQHARAARHFEPVIVDGVPCCCDCEAPLEPHRVERGICVDCMAARERREKGQRR